MECAVNAQRQRQQHRNQSGRGCQLHGGRQLRHEFIQHRFLSGIGLAQVALEELEHVSCVTNDDIVVETVFFSSLFHLLLCQALFRCLDVNDVAGSQIHDEVDNEGDADYHRNQLQQSSDGIP